MNECSNCGEQLGYGIKFCPKCNTENNVDVLPLEQPKEPIKQEVVQEEIEQEVVQEIVEPKVPKEVYIKNKSKKPIIMGFVVIAVIVGLIAILSLVGEPVSLDVVMDNTDTAIEESFENMLADNPLLSESSSNTLIPKYDFDLSIDTHNDYTTKTILVDKTGNNLDIKYLVHLIGYDDSFTDVFEANSILSENKIEGTLSNRVSDLIDVHIVDYVFERIGDDFVITLNVNKLEGPIVVKFNGLFNKLNFNKQLTEDMENIRDNIFDEAYIDVSSSKTLEKGFDSKYKVKVNPYDLAKIYICKILNEYKMEYDLLDFDISYAGQTISTTDKIAKFDKYIEIFENTLIKYEIDDNDEYVDIVIKTKNDKIKYLYLDDFSIQADNTNDYINNTYKLSDGVTNLTVTMNVKENVLYLEAALSGYFDQLISGYFDYAINIDFNTDIMTFIDVKNGEKVEKQLNEETDDNIEIKTWKYNIEFNKK